MIFKTLQILASPDKPINDQDYIASSDTYPAGVQRRTFQKIQMHDTSPCQAWPRAASTATLRTCQHHEGMFVLFSFDSFCFTLFCFPLVSLFTFFLSLVVVFVVVVVVVVVVVCCCVCSIEQQRSRYHQRPDNNMKVCFALFVFSLFQFFNFFSFCSCCCCCCCCVLF